MGHLSSVAVIGAGPSGLVCARALDAAGFRVGVLDKGRGPGGRTSTRRAESRGAQIGFDHGAQYFTVRDDEVANLVDEWEAAEVVRPWNGRIVAIDRPGVFSESTPKPRFVGTPGMSALCGHLASDLPVQCGVEVARIDREADGIALFGHDGGSLGNADVVVCTAPPAQTAALLAEVSPKMAVKASSVRMKPCWAVMAAFEPSVTAPCDGAFVNVGPLSWVARDSSKPGRDGTLDRWVLHAGPDWSAAHLEDDRDAVAAALVEAFFRALGLEPRAPVWQQAHRWRYALAENPLEVGCLVDSSNRIVACGDWAGANRVEGAILSGLAAARAIQETRRSGER